MEEAEEVEEVEEEQEAEEVEEEEEGSGLGRRGHPSREGLHSLQWIEYSL